MLAIVMPPENHFARSRLQHAGDSDVDRLRNQPTGIVDYDHGAVIKVCDSLIVFLAFLQNEHPHDLARQHHRPQSIGELVDVQHLYLVKLRDLVEVEVIGDDFAVVQLAELDQFLVDLARVRKVLFDDLHIDIGHLLKTLQDVEAAPATVSFHRVRRIGDQLQLPQHELRNDQRAFEKTGLGDIRDTAVDDYTSVENLEACPSALFRSKDAAEGSEVQHFTFRTTDYQSD